MIKRLLLLLIISSGLLTLIGCNNQLVNGTGEVAVSTVDEQKQTNSIADAKADGVSINNDNSSTEVLLSTKDETPAEEVVTTPKKTTEKVVEKTSAVKEEVKEPSPTKVEVVQQTVRKETAPSVSTSSLEKETPEVKQEVGISKPYIKMPNNGGFKPPISEEAQQKKEEQKRIAQSKNKSYESGREYGIASKKPSTKRRMSKGTSSNSAFKINILSKEELDRSGTKAVNWLSLDEAQRRHNASPKKWLVFVHTEWCANCPKMEKSLMNASVAEYINKNFYPVMIDAEDKTPFRSATEVYGFNETAGRNGTHEFILYLLRGSLGYPALAIWDESQTIPQAKKGYLNPHDTYKFIKYFGDNYDKQFNWQEFMIRIND